MENPLFSYRYGNTFLYKIPSTLKIILLFVIPLILFSCSMPILIVSFFIFLIIGFLNKISFLEIVKNIKPVFYYAFFLIIAHILSVFSLFLSDPTLLNATLFIPGMDTFLIIARIITAMECTSLFFFTTTSLELKEGIGKLESIVTFKKSSGSFSQTFALFILFIPTVFSVWTQLNNAWKARGGKNSIKKLYTLIPPFISILLHKAHTTELSLRNRL